MDSVFRNPGWQRSSDEERAFPGEEASGLSCHIQVSFEDEQEVSHSALRDNDSHKEGECIFLESRPCLPSLVPLISFSEPELALD